MMPLLCGLMVILLFRFVFIIGIVSSESMEPTIRKGTIVFGLRILAEPKREDIIFFRHEGRMLIKRVAAVPGDVVYINDYEHSVTVNEVMEGATRVLTVPEGCYFVLGNNAEDSWDSRHWSEVWVKQNSVCGKKL